MSALGDSATGVVLHPSPRDAGAATVAVYLRQGGGPLRVRGILGFFDPRCSGVELRLGSVARGHGFEEDAGIVGHPGTPPLAFSASVDIPDGRRLALLLTIPEGQASTDYCLVRVDALRVATETGD